MNPLNLAEIRECVAQGDRMAALEALRAAIDDERIAARDGIELMLVVRRGSPEMMAKAVDSLAWGVPGAFRFVPKPEHVAA